MTNIKYAKNAKTGKPYRYQYDFDTNEWYWQCFRCGAEFRNHHSGGLGMAKSNHLRMHGVNTSRDTG